MVSKSTAKFIKSLQLKKYRKQEQCFLVEGAKSVLEVLKSDYNIRKLVTTEAFLAGNGLEPGKETIITTSDSLSNLGSFKSNNAAIAVVEMRQQIRFQPADDEYIIALDGINDPGNLGTIIRIADWYGIRKIIVSEETADIYNPKTISASKGSFIRIDIFYLDIYKTLKDLKIPVYGAVLTGKSVHEAPFSKSGIILMGNETHGISGPVSSLIDIAVTIPSYGQAESLNVAVATAIICDNVKRVT